MPVYSLEAYTHNPKTGQPYPALQPQAIRRLVLYFPGSPKQLGPFLNQHRIGTPGVHYKFFVWSEESKPLGGPTILAVEPAYLSQGAPPVTTNQHVQGGQPTGVPTAQPNQQRLDSPIDDRSGFQRVGDGALGSAQDNIFGSFEDGTITDLVHGQNGLQEVPRPQATPAQAPGQPQQ